LLPSSRLPATVDAFLNALRSGNLESASGKLHEDVLVLDHQREYRGSMVRSWLEARLARPESPMRILHQRWKDGELILTLAAEARDEGEDCSLVDWIFRCTEDRIAGLVIEKRLCPGLVPAARGFLTAVNRGDVAAIVASFAEDALVNDELVDHRGTDQIRQWATHDIVGKKLAMVAVDALVRKGGLVVTCHASGDFDAAGLPDPLIVNLYISESEGAIDQLIVLPRYVG
jgi:hypothetical protein